MHTHSLNNWQHSHSFGQEHVKEAEKYTIIVICITALTMILEITAGILFGSMALLADGVHMGTHTLALGIAAFSYYYTRKHANDKRFSFGTGKVNSMGGFSSALLLIVFAFSLIWESVERLLSPVEIQFNQAIVVAAAGLLVNIISAWILSRPHTASKHSHHDHSGHHGHTHQDHNLKAAYLHVIADALTSVFALVALFAGKIWGLVWMDPLMGILGAILVSRWAWGLLNETSGILLDCQAPEENQAIVRKIIENDDDRISDLHIWTIGESLYAVNVSIVTDSPQPPSNYKRLLSKHKEFAHITVEVHKCQ
jgi:cation diffusion facilitator family transporter